MKLNRVQRDELLSAYLDGELGFEERRWLETCLSADPSLRQDLESLRRTVRAVGALPDVPLPRNFVLPHDFKARSRPQLSRRRWLAPFLSFATAAVSMLFVIVLGMDLWAGRMLPAAMTASEQDEAVAAQVREVEVEERAAGVDAGTEAPGALAMAPSVSPDPAPAEESALGFALTPDAALAATPNGLLPYHTQEAPEVTSSAGVWADEGTASPEVPLGVGGGAPPPAVTSGGGEEDTPDPVGTAVVDDAPEAQELRQSELYSDELPIVPGTESGAGFGRTGQPSFDQEAGRMWEQPLDEGSWMRDGLTSTAPAGREMAAQTETGERGIPGALSVRTLEVVLGSMTLGLLVLTTWAWWVRRRP